MTTKRGRPAGAKNTPADEQIRKDILRVYKRLGGVKWLESWVRADPKNATEFVKQGLAKVLAQPMLRAIEQQQELAGPMSPDDERRAAMQVAFVLSQAVRASGEPLVVEGEVVEPVQPAADWQAPSWMPPADQEPVAAVETPLGAEEPKPVEQPALPAPEPVPERRSLADLLGFEPPAAVEQSLYGGGPGQYRSGDAAEQGTQRRDLIGDVRVVQRETVAEKLRRHRGG